MSTGKQDNLWNVWGQALGGWFDRDTQDGISGYTLTTGGAAFGLDRKFGSLIQTGRALGYSNSNLSWNDPGNSGHIDGKHIGVYGSTQYSGFYLDGIAGYTSLDNSADRTITTPVFTDKVASSFGSSVWAGNLSGGYDFTFGELRVGPTVSIDYQHLNQDGFSDNGAQDFDVQMHGGTAESLTSSLGLRLTGVFKEGDWRFLPRAGLSWLHQFKDDAVRLTTNFVDYPAATFTVAGADPAANQAMGSLGLSAEYNKNLSLYLDFSAAIANNQNSKLLAGGLTWTF